MKKKKIPMRKCVVTNQILPKIELIRISFNKEGKLFVDHSGKASGRGVYLQPKIELVEKAKKTKVLSKVLKIEINNDEIYEQISNEIKKFWD